MTTFLEFLVIKKSAPDNLDGAPDGYHSPDFTNCDTPVWPVPSPIPLKVLPDPTVKIVSDRSVIFRRYLPASFVVAVASFVMGIYWLFALSLLVYVGCAVVTGLLFIIYLKQHTNFSFPLTLPFTLSRLTAIGAQAEPRQ